VRLRPDLGADASPSGDGERSSHSLPNSITLFLPRSQLSAPIFLKQSLFTPILRP
jgi:hypothetical protein